METIPLDLNSVYKSLTRTRAGRSELIDVPELQFLMIDGRGSPDDPGFAAAIETLYGLSYTIKFALKKSGSGPNYSVPPLEGLYDVEDWSGAFSPADREHLVWTLMIAQPPYVTVDHLKAAIGTLSRKKPGAVTHLVRLEMFAEGRCVQALHIGPYSTESVTTEHIHDFLEANGLMVRGRQHEIYLGDPRRAAPEKLKTLLRWPVSQKG